MLHSFIKSHIFDSAREIPYCSEILSHLSEPQVIAAALPADLFCDSYDNCNTILKNISELEGDIHLPVRYDDIQSLPSLDIDLKSAKVPEDSKKLAKNCKEQIEKSIKEDISRLKQASVSYAEELWQELENQKVHCIKMNSFDDRISKILERNSSILTKFEYAADLLGQILAKNTTTTRYKLLLEEDVETYHKLESESIIEVHKQLAELNQKVYNYLTKSLIKDPLLYTDCRDMQEKINKLKSKIASIK